MTTKRSKPAKRRKAAGRPRAVRKPQNPCSEKTSARARTPIQARPPAAPRSQRSAGGLEAIADRLRARALAYPETYEEAPWGDRVVKVRGRIFLFCGTHNGNLGVTVKLPESRTQVLAEPFAKPTGYGLGRSGWVSATFASGEIVDEARIAGWIDESFRAIAPRKLVAAAEAQTPARAAAGAQDERGRGASHPPRVSEPRASRSAGPASSKRVVLLCEDALRADRARRVLAERGISVDVVDEHTEVRGRIKRKAVDAVIIDVGRREGEGLALAGEIDASDDPILLFVVGLRDATSRRRAQEAATSADLFRAPPGDAAVVDAVVATLARY
jgi:predicted DNA-binding protein (MmcQ/YjbR family)